LPSSVLARARRALKSIQLPSGYQLRLAGEDEELRENRAEMSLVLKVSLALITLAMVLQFNSVVKSIVVMLTVPLGAIGAFVGLAVSHSPFGFTALLGLVSLVNDAASELVYPLVPLYLASLLMAQSGVTNTPVLTVAYGGPTRAINFSTVGRIPSTMISSPSAFGLPSGWRRSGFPATPSMKLR
jgi:hypothetical protein